MNIIIILLFISSSQFCQAKVYNRLFEDLLGRYNKIARPAKNPNDTIYIQFKLRLSQIVDVHEKDQVVTTNGWLTHHWFDYRLAWNPSWYSNITNLPVPGEVIWLPDIILYNNAHGSPSVGEITKASVRFDGLVTWTPPYVYNSMCKMDVKWFPYDEQYCEMKFGSWTYSGTQLDMIHLLSDSVDSALENGERVWKVQEGVDITEYQESVEWDLLSIESVRHEKWYPCCDYPSIDITFYLNIRRKKLFYTINLITPCVGLAALTSWVFYLPCESHNKIQLCISVLVSLSVFFLVLIEIIPPTSLVMPLIGNYLIFTMFMVSLSVIFTVVKIDALNAMSILEKQFNKTLFEIEMASQEKEKAEETPHSAIFMQLPMLSRSKSYKPSKVTGAVVTRQRTMRRQCSTDRGPLNSSVKTKERENMGRREILRKAERNVYYISQHLTDMRKNDEAEADWQFVSSVIDRILLIIFGTVITIGTGIVLFSAPSLTDPRQPINKQSADEFF